MKDASHRDFLSEASLLAAVFFLGTNPVAVKYAILEIPPLVFVALRFTLAGLLLWTFRKIAGVGEPLGARELLRMAGVGAFGVGLNNVLFTLGVSMTSASETALIYATPPLWGMLLGFLLGQERPTKRGVAGVAIAMVGVTVVVSGGMGSTAPSFAGDLLVMGGAVCWGSYTVLGMRLLRRHPPITVAAYTTLFGGLATLPLGIWALLKSYEIHPGVAAGTAAAYSTFLVAAYGFFAWQRGVFRLGANRVLVYQYLITLIGVVSGILALGERLGPAQILGGAVILAGVFAARKQ